jgi:SAM-dependent MidA family methyltransferase
LLIEILKQRIRERGPLTVAAFMDLALYHPEHGYYAREARRSGRAGDFFTSVDVGPMFGELLAVQIAEMARDIDPFDFVEAGAGDGRLSADILRALRRLHPAVFARLRLHLVEASPAARQAQVQALGDVGDRLVSSSDVLPDSFSGVLLANELLDAIPVHQVVMRSDGLREVYADLNGDARLMVREGPVSSPALQEYLDRAGATLEPGWRVEIGLRARDWVRSAGRRLSRGFAILIDYGHEAAALYSASHSAGTLTSFSRHTSAGAETAGVGEWLARPGEQDITAHVDFTTVQEAARQSGLSVLGLMDQTYFLLGLLERQGARELSAGERRAVKTLVMPGGLGSTFKVLILGKGVDRTGLSGCSYPRLRLT